MQIRVNNTSTISKKGAKGVYSVLTLAYDKDGEGKSRKFTSYDKLWKTLKELKEGDVINVTTKKNEESGYYDWTAIEKASAAEPRSASKPSEDANTRDLRIVRQSALKAAASSTRTPEETITVAEQYVKWVFSAPKPVTDPNVEITDGEDEEVVD